MSGRNPRKGGSRILFSQEKAGALLYRNSGVREPEVMLTVPPTFTAYQGFEQRWWCYSGNDAILSPYDMGANHVTDQTSVTSIKVMRQAVCR